MISSSALTGHDKRHLLHYDSVECVSYVYWRQAGQPFNVNDDKLGTSVVPAGETFEWRDVTSGYCDLVAYGQNNNVLDAESGIFVPRGDYTAGL